MVLQLSAKSHPDLPKVPLAMNLAKTDEARKLIQAVAQAHGAAVRPYLLPPNTPKDRVEILRKAFMEAVKDPELLNEASKANLEINPGSGEELERNVKDLLRLVACSGRTAEGNFKVGNPDRGALLLFGLTARAHPRRRLRWSSLHIGERMTQSMELIPAQYHVPRIKLNRLISRSQPRS